MTQLSLAALVWLGTHVGLSSTPLRAALVARLGDKLFQAAYSILSIVVLVWLVRAYNDAPYVALWPLGSLLSALALLLNFSAFILLIGGVTLNNPTSAAAGDAAPGEPRGILRVTRHPVMWGIGLWAIAHVLTNGDLASLILFGSMAVLALGGTRLIDAKTRARRGAAWNDFFAKTSNVPFGKLLRGEQPFSLAELGWWRIGLGILVFAAFLYVHPWLFGVSGLGML